MSRLFSFCRKVNAVTSEYLGGGITVFCSGVHQVNTDAILLSHFAAQGKMKNVCDLGSGCGIIPLLWLRDNKNLHAVALEIQQSAVDLLNKSVEYNNLKDRLDVVHGDLNCACEYLQKGSFDLVTMNPPYKKLTGGVMSDNESANIARFEVKCSLDDITGAAALLLKPQGRLCMCHRPERLCDLLCSMRGAGLEPKRMQIVCHTAADAPQLVLVEARRGGRANMEILPPFVLYNSDGSESEQTKQVYKVWREVKNG
jgi:tRNA1Val (adenine37-N6)-methyltransferase